MIEIDQKQVRKGTYSTNGLREMEGCREAKQESDTDGSTGCSSTAPPLLHHILLHEKNTSLW